jgi:hypothetical protein
MQRPNDVENDVGKVQSERETWRTRLSIALQRWCEQNGYSVLKVLADELEVSYRILGGVVHGVNIARGDVYAKIFFRTGLLEADPRRIPARVMATPKSSKKIIVSLAWKEGQWQDWLRNMKGEEDQDASGDSPVEKVPVFQGSPATLALAEAIKEIVKEGVQEALVSGQENRMSTIEVIERLYEDLENIAGLPVEERERRGRALQIGLGKILTLVQAFTEEDVNIREDVLRLRRKVRLNG